MANRSPSSSSSSPTHHPNTSNELRMMESMVSAENSQRQYLDLMLSGRTTAGPSSINHSQEWSLENFLQHHPAKFNGKCSPDEADQWFKDMERIFNAKRCPNESRLAYSEYLLTGEASHWWSSARPLLESSGIPICWEIFKQKFYTEYFPDSVRFAKEVEFLQLVQGNIKFENGLRGDIKLPVAGLCIKEFPVLVERAKVLEKTKLEVDSQQKHLVRAGGPIISRDSIGSRKTPYARSSLSSGGSGSSSQSLALVGQSRQPGSITCFHCGGPHFKSVCPQLGGYKRCNRCRQEGHWERECPMGRRVVSRPPNTGRFQHRGGGRAQAVGRVYAMTRTEATNAGNLITSTCLLNDVSCCVLFDSGATHSFISKECVEKLGLSVRELQFDLVVSTPTADEVRTTTYCAKCSIVVEGRRFKVNLICLPLQGLEVILGMDWLMTNHILIDCGERKLIFPKEDFESSLTIGVLRRDIMEGASCFLVFSHLDVPFETDLDRSVQDDKSETISLFTPISC
ncbi:uncharacterized protein LOC108322887 [Vigna angularis]|uniref:uncharacterized protein LOC108322887 n=1 Tax=Phaseolus angularis TaxID=3914 RepID=UPI0022B4DE59|nr:uncharacterized protein LOC108322887 [Vigna angularis]